eukprot:scaffold207086_cov31-Tisochrysis_lutea.AAC.1
MAAAPQKALVKTIDMNEEMEQDVITFALGARRAMRERADLHSPWADDGRKTAPWRLEEYALR